MAKHTYQDLVDLINQVISESSVRLVLLEFLTKLKNLQTAPASGALRYHHAYEGGLVDHIIDVFTLAKTLSANLQPAIHGQAVVLSVKDLLLVSILHDIHKTQDAQGAPYYVPNILKSGKRSEAEPFEHGGGYLKQACSVEALANPADRERDYLYLNAVDGISGGIKSLALIYALSQALFKLLDDDVKFAIRYHDGVYACNKYELGGKETPLQIVFHCADMLSSRLNRLK